MRPKVLETLICLILILFPLFLSAQEAQFAVISDTHVGAKDSAYLALLRSIKEDGMGTIIHTGDAINSPGNMYEWKRFVAAQGPQQTIHLAPGNHDITDKESLETYRKFFPNLYSSFSEGDTLFILLNSRLPGEESTIQGKQLLWLEGELKRSFRYKFVFLHEPLFPVIHKGLALHEESRDLLHELFVELGVSLVVSGHDHIYRRYIKDGITYIIMPPARGGTTQLINEMEPGYLAVYRRNGSYSFFLKSVQGKIRDEFLVAR